MRNLLGGALRYNLITALQIALAATFQVLLARVFGASFLTDAYLVSLLFVTFVATIASALAELFTQYYHQIKVESPAEAVRFYQAVLNITLGAGLASSAAALSIATPLVRLLAPGFGAEQLETFRAVLSVLTLGVTGSAAIRVNSTLLRAEMRFLPTYLLGLLAPALNVITILVCGADYGILAIAGAGAASAMLGFAIQQAYIARALKIRWAPVPWHPRLTNLVVNSVLLRLGHQLWDFRDMVATNVLSVFPGGTVTLYFYGARVISMAFSVTSAAWLEMFLSMTSSMASRNDFPGMRALLRRSLLASAVPFAAALVALAVLLPELLALFVGARLSASERATIYGVFLALIPFYLIVSIESPWATIAIALGQSLRVAVIGAAFIVVCWSAAVWLRPALGLYAIPAALAAAQAHNLLWYWTNGRRVLQRAGDVGPGGAARTRTPEPWPR